MCVFVYIGRSVLALCVYPFVCVNLSHGESFVTESLEYSYFMPQSWNPGWPGDCDSDDG